MIRITLPAQPQEHVAFAVSPLLECVLSLHVLLGPKHHALQHGWVRRMRARSRAAAGDRGVRLRLSPADPRLLPADGRRRAGDLRGGDRALPPARTGAAAVGARQVAPRSRRNRRDRPRRCREGRRRGAARRSDCVRRPPRRPARAVLGVRLRRRMGAHRADPRRRDRRGRPAARRRRDPARARQAAGPLPLRSCGERARHRPSP